MSLFQLRYGCSPPRIGDDGWAGSLGKYLLELEFKLGIILTL